MGTIDPWIRRATVCLCLWIGACGGEDEELPAAGSGALPVLGQTCDGPVCAEGLICSKGGFRGQCTAQCTGTPGCLLRQNGTTCVPGAPGAVSECGVACTGPQQCPVGTQCLAKVGGVSACYREP